MNSRQWKRKHSIDIKEVWEMCHNLKAEIESELMKVKDPALQKEVKDALGLVANLEKKGVGKRKPSHHPRPATKVHIKSRLS